MYQFWAANFAHWRYTEWFISQRPAVVISWKIRYNFWCWRIRNHKRPPLTTQEEISLQEHIWHGPGLSVYDRQKCCQLNTHTWPAQTIKITWTQFWYKCTSSRGKFSCDQYKRQKEKEQPSDPKQAKTKLKNRPVAAVSPKPRGKYLFLKVLFPVVHSTFPVNETNINNTEEHTHLVWKYLLKTN